MLKIRKAKIRDWKSIRRILEQTTFSKEDIQDVKNILNHGEGCFVAIKNNRIIGTISGHWHGKKANIEQIAVLPSHQSRGIGATLLNTIADYFKNKGEVKIYAGGVKNDIVPFYKKYGFKGNERELVKELQ